MLRGSSQAPNGATGGLDRLEPVLVDARAALDLKRYRLMLLVPDGLGQGTKKVDQISVELGGKLTEGFNKLLRFANPSKANLWNKLTLDEASCVLHRIIAKKGVSTSAEDMRAYNRCSLATNSHKTKARPWALLKEDADGLYLFVLPLREELRHGLTWEDSGHWVSGMSRA